MKHVVFVVTALAFAGAAHAELPFDTSGPMPDPKTRVELGVGFDMGSLSLGSHGDAAAGFHVELGLRFDRLALLAESSWLFATFDPRATPVPSVDDLHPASSAPTWGSSRRDLLVARYSIVRGREAVTAKHSHRVLGYNRFDDWLEVGIGREELDLHPGGSSSRPLAAVGFGLQATGRDDNRHAGAYFGFRILAGPAPAGGYDRAALFTIGVLFGN